jgi:hypothetical protein
MYTILAALLDRLDHPQMAATNVIKWGCPVPSFGDLSRSTVATLGLNPSNREFLDNRGSELLGAARRFHTLRSLGLATWGQADVRHLRLITESCRSYFRGNPYDRWFRRLDQVLHGTGASFYDESAPACHLDLIPYATSRKWAELTPKERSSLLAMTRDCIGRLLRNSPVRVLVLNGKSVVTYFERMAEVTLEAEPKSEWSLPRAVRPNVIGFAYRGMFESLAGIGLDRPLLVLGFNHNLQSSFGVTGQAVEAIRSWITEATMMGVSEA